MNISKNRAGKALAFAVSLIAVLTAIPVSQAHAAQPSMQVIPINDSFIAPYASSFCGFDILRTDTGRLTITTWYDENGNISRQLVTVSVHTTFSANGQTLTGITALQGTITNYPDGSMTVQTTGPSVFTHAPGQGTVWGYTGNQTFYISPTGDATLLRDYHNNQLDNPAFCAALAP